MMFQNIITNTNFFFAGRSIFFRHLHISANYEEPIKMQVIKISVNDDKIYVPCLSQMNSYKP